MKKYIFSALVLATSLVACTDDYQDWANPQAVEQPAATTFGNGSVTAVGLIDFATIAENQATVKVCSITAPTATDGAYTQASYKLVMGENGTTLDIASDGMVAVADLKAYIESVYGKAPVERDMAASVEQWISNGTTTIKTGAADVNIKALLVAPYISPYYYIVGATQGWNITSDAQKFSHSDKNIYDDPVFTITVKAPYKEDGVTRDDFWFVLGTEKTITGEWSECVGSTRGNGDSELSGHLDTRANIGNDACFMMPASDGAKFYKITINAMDATYAIEPLTFQEYIFLPGNAQGWNPSTASALKHEGDGLYTGFAYMDGEFKFTKERNWNAEYNAGDFTQSSTGFDLSGGAGSNIKFTDAPGVYYFEVNVSTGELKATRVEKIGLIGDFNGWGADFEMTWNAEELCYEAQNPGVTAAGWKFRLNGDWAINFGGALDNLTKDGSNIDVVGTTVKFYPTRSTKDNIYCTVE